MGGTLQLLGGKPDGQQSQQPRQQQTQRPQQTQRQPDNAPDYDDYGIQF